MDVVPERPARHVVHERVEHGVGASDPDEHAPDVWRNPVADQRFDGNAHEEHRPTQAEADHQDAERVRHVDVVDLRRDDAEPAEVVHPHLGGGLQLDVAEHHHHPRDVVGHEGCDERVRRVEGHGAGVHVLQGKAGQDVLQAYQMPVVHDGKEGYERWDHPTGRQHDEQIPRLHPLVVGRVADDDVAVHGYYEEVQDGRGAQHDEAAVKQHAHFGS